MLVVNAAQRMDTLIDKLWLPARCTLILANKHVLPGARLYNDVDPINDEAVSLQRRWQAKLSLQLREEQSSSFVTLQDTSIAQRLLSNLEYL